MMFDDQENDKEAEQQYATLEDFVSAYSRINVVNHGLFAESWIKYTNQGVSFEESIGPYSLWKHSRDKPNPVMHMCPHESRS